MSRNLHNQEPLLDVVERLEKYKRGEIKQLTLEQKKAIYLAECSLTTVYFVAAVDAAMIKIGKTVDLTKRLNTLRSMSPVPLELACSIDYDAGLERRIHQHLSDHRSHGEWFNATKEVVDFMRGYCDHGIRWVVEAVGDCPGNWIDNNGKMMGEEMRFERQFGGGPDPDYSPNTQNKSGIDFGGVYG
jgi:hypothetical protein